MVLDDNWHGATVEQPRGLLEPDDDVVRSDCSDRFATGRETSTGGAMSM